MSQDSIVQVPSILRKIQNGHQQEYWVSLDNPSLSVDVPLGSIPNFAPGEGTASVVDGNIVYFGIGAEVYQAGPDSALYSFDFDGTELLSSAQASGQIYFGANNGLYGFDPTAVAGQLYFNTSETISSMDVYSDQLYYISGNNMYAIALADLEPDMTPPAHVLQFEEGVMVHIVAIGDRLYLIKTDQDTSYLAIFNGPHQGVEWQAIAPATPNLTANVVDVAGLFSYHNNTQYNNHFLYLINESQQLIAVYPESPQLEASPVGTGYKYNAVASSPYDSTGAGQDSFLYGAAIDGEQMIGNQVNPVLNTLIFLGFRTTVLPNNSFEFGNEPGQSSLQFWDLNGEAQNPIQVYLQPNTTGEGNFDMLAYQDYGNGAEVVPYVEYETEPEDGYYALMAVLHRKGGIVILGEMDLDPVLGDPGAYAQS